MKRLTKPIFALVLATAMIVAAMGCSLVSVNEEKDLAQVVAKVGDYEITKSAYMADFEYMLYMYQSFGLDPTASAEEYEAFKLNILDQVISTEIQYYQAVQKGLDKQLSEEALAEIQEQVDYYDTEIFTMAKTEADAVAAADATADYDQALTDAYKSAALSYIGQELNQPDTRAYIETTLTKQAVVGLLTDEFYASVSVTDEEVQQEYDSQLEWDIEALTTTPSDYKDLQESYERNGGVGPLYAPEGYLRVKHILFTPDEEALPEGYDQGLITMGELESELGLLTLQDKQDDPEIAARIEEIKAEYAALKTETESIYATYFSKSKQDAEAAYEKLQNGSSFDDVLKEYTADEDFITYEIFQQKGKLMFNSTEVADWDDELKQAVLKLTEKGSYTEILANDEGYHILQYVDVEPSGNRGFEQFKDALHEQVLSEKQSSEWNILIEEWISDDKIVTRYTDVLETI